VKERDNILVLFDFDGTLNKKDSLFQFIAFYKGKLIKYFGLLVLSPVLIGVFFRLLSRHRAKELVISYFFKGEDELKFGNECRKFVNNVLVKSLNSDALNVLNDYKKSGDRIIIISASMEYYIREIANLLGVVFLFLLARERVGVIGGITSVLILMSVPVYFGTSYLVVNDVPLSTFVIGTVFFAVKYNNTGKLKFFYLSLVFSGLAMSTKIFGVLAILSPFLAYTLNHKLSWKKLKKHWKVAVIPLGVYLFFNPHAFIVPGTLFHHLSWVARLYKSGEGQFSKTPGWEQINYQISQMNSSYYFGKEFFFLAIGGIVVGLLFVLLNIKQIRSSNRSVNFLIISVLPIIYFLYITRQSIAYHRNYLLLYPFLALWATEALLIPRALLHHYVSKIAIIPIIFSTVILTAVTYYQYPRIKNIYSWGFEKYYSVETRTLAFQELKKISQEEKIFAGIENGFKISQENPRESGIDISGFNIRNLNSALNGFTHLIIPKYDYNKDDSNNPDSNTINQIDSIITGRAMINIPGSAINYSHDILYPDLPIINPQVIILKGSDYPPPEMERYKEVLHQVDYITVAWDKTDKTVEVFKRILGKGKYVIQFDSYATSAFGEYPELEITINGKPIFDTVVNWPELKSVEFSFESTEDAKYVMEASLLNDAYDKETGDDRNVIITYLELKRDTRSE